MALTVGERFAEAVRRAPEAVVLDAGERRLTYAGMEALAASVAAGLEKLGTQAPGRVAILSEDRVGAIAAMLGTACSGHAYVPLDTGDPEERLRYIIEDSQPFALLADAVWVDRARALAPSNCAVLDLDVVLSAPAKASPCCQATPESLLYLIYTSGSTGLPKGVRQTHRNLLFFADAYARKMSISAADRVSLLYTLSFSASNMDIYGALLNGAALCPHDMRRNGLPELADWLEQQSISVLHAVPTVFRELSRTLEPSRRFPTIRAIDLGGETLFGEDVARFRPHVSPDCRFINHLAATEASVIAQYAIDPQQAQPAGPLPAGVSPDGVEVRILRTDGSAAAIGENGFIAVDSPYLSPGYWRQPQLDAAFFSDLAGRPGWRRYQGGDMGRIDEGGLLHFIGREGSRIKLHGQSIDLAEVEATLQACDGVRDAVVIPRGPDDGEANHLIACLVMSRGAARNPLNLRRQLAGRLPAYMLPGGYVFLDRLPHTATGKVDRRALSRVDLEQACYRPDFVAPVDVVEQRIADIYSGLLKFEPVGRMDDFFLLGGDSMLLVELQLQLRNVFGHELPDLYRDATVAGLAARMRASGQEPASAMPRVLPLRTEGLRPPLFLVHGRNGQAHVGPHFMTLLGKEQPLYSIQARGVDDLEPPWGTVEEMAADYVRAVRAQQPVGPYFLGALCAGGYIAMEMARLLRQAGEQVLPLLLIDLPAPPFQPGGRQIGDDRLLDRMRQRATDGTMKIDMNDPNMVRAALQVARTFDMALGKYRISPYDGTVCLISCIARLEPGQWGSKEKQRQVFSGHLDIFPAEARHFQMLDPRSRIFGKQLARCLALIHKGEGMRPEENNNPARRL